VFFLTEKLFNTSLISDGKAKVWLEESAKKSSFNCSKIPQKSVTISPIFEQIFPVLNE
jgi:hypothetical protein